MVEMLYDMLRPLLFRLEPETAHHFAIFWLRALSRSGALCRVLAPRFEPQKAKTVFGVKFPHPIGLAAGFDKNAVALPAWEALGFGFVEAGTVTAQAQPGNPRPRIFRYPRQRALINRMGFNNDGAEKIAARLGQLRASGRWPRIPVGINLGKSKVTPLEEAPADYLRSLEALHAFADYLVLNVSSPNTPGLRQLQDRAALAALLSAVQRRNGELGRKPLLLKIAPDLGYEQIEEILNLVETHGLAGLIATNTTLDHSAIAESAREQGGLSGAPLRTRATKIVRFLAARTHLPVIASGGICDADAVREKFDAGAALVQLYTGFIYQGPRLIRAAS